MPAALIILMFVLITIALRRIKTLVIPIWLIMAVGAGISIGFQQISLSRALFAIEPNVMLYLFGFFLISQAAEESGYLAHLTNKIFFHAQTGKQVLFIVVFVFGLSAALLMNDTIAIVGTPIILQLCKSHKNLTKPLLFALAFSITIGSTLSPIGNPQNLLIAVKSGLASPFVYFIKSLTIPTLINLIATYFFIAFIYRNTLSVPVEKTHSDSITDYKTVKLVKISLVILLLFLIIKIITDSIEFSIRINFGCIAILSALPILLSQKRWTFIKQLDWGTLIFFASTFILMQSVWDSGFFQENIANHHLAVTKIAIIILSSIVLSQFISNVPLVALYLPLLINQHVSDSHYLALAVGSTIAGNLSILGAASNVIIIQNAEKRGIKGFDFFEFIKIGAPLTIINTLIYTYFLYV